MAAPSGNGGTGRGFRPDVQGLRAVAVALVVLQHTFAWPLGGFLGVDVFYVISGFLITSLLLREIESTGTISMRGFYARRVRRILPAASVVLLAVTVAAAILWYVPRALQTALDALSAVLFVSNWHFIGVNVDYLAGAAATSPVQHFWSLSIEEQFYAIWPLLLLLLLGSFRGSRRALTAAVVLLFAASLAWAAAHTATDPTAAYFDTFARAWELLAGALVALFGTAGPRVPRRVRSWVSGFGVALIVAASILVTPTLALPFPWVAPAVLGAVLVVWARAEAGPRSLLGNRVSRWIGDISYSLYLWHLPVYVFAISIFGTTPLVAILSLVVMVGLAALSYRFVEQPFIRRAAMRPGSPAPAPLQPPDPAPTPAPSRSSLPTARIWMVRALGLVAITALVASLGYSQLRGPLALRSAEAHKEWFTRPPAVAVDTDRTMQDQRNELAAALAADSFPDAVDGELNHLSRRFAAAELLRPCMNSVMQDREVRYCGKPKRDEIFVLGDSAAVSWAPTVRAFAEQQQLGGVTTMGFSNCSLFDVAAVDRTGLQSFVDGCAERREQMFAFVEEWQPSIVVLSASESVLKLTGLPPVDAANEYRAGVERSLARLREIPLVVILTGVPHAGDPRSCATRVSSPDGCVGEVSDNSVRKDAADVAVAADFANVVTVPVSEWFCAEARCPVFIGEHLARIDPSHLSEATGSSLGPLLAEVLSVGVQKKLNTDLRTLVSE